MSRPGVVVHPDLFATAGVTRIDNQIDCLAISDDEANRAELREEHPAVAAITLALTIVSHGDGF